MILSSYVTVDGWLTTFRISQKPIASVLRQSDQNQNQSKNKFLGFGLGQRLAMAWHCLFKSCYLIACMDNSTDLKLKWHWLFQRNIVFALTGPAGWWDKTLNLFDRMKPTITESEYTSRVQVVFKTMPNSQAYKADVEVIIFRWWGRWELVTDNRSLGSQGCWWLMNTSSTFTRTTKAFINRLAHPLKSYYGKDSKLSS